MSDLFNGWPEDGEPNPEKMSKMELMREVKSNQAYNLRIIDMQQQTILEQSEEIERLRKALAALERDDE